MTTVLGDFLGPAGDCITHATAYRDDLPSAAVDRTARELSRVITALGGYLGDLALPDRAEQAAPQDAFVRATVTTRLALRRSAITLRRATEAAEPFGTGPMYPPAARLAAAADYLTASRDLLQDRRQLPPPSSPAMLAGQFYWAAVAASPEVTAALLAEMTGHARALAPWAAQLSQAAAGDTTRMALHDAARWLYTAAGTADTWQQHRSLGPAARRLLHSIPVMLVPARHPPSEPESVADLCTGIIRSADRLRCAAIGFAPHALSSPAANSMSWRRHALATAITSHASHLVLRGLAKRGRLLGADPDVCTQLDQAAAAARHAWPRLRAVSHAWDTISTGMHGGAEITPVAAEIDDLVLRVGRLAYGNLRWSPDASQSGPVRDPARLAPTLHDITTIVEAIHHAADAVMVIEAADRQAVQEAARAGRLYMPTRLLPEDCNVPYPYGPCPGSHVRPLVASYKAALQATAAVTTALDDLAIQCSLPSAILAAPRRNPPPGANRRPAALYEREAKIGFPEAGQVEGLLHDLHVTDPAMLERAELADATALDLITEVSCKIGRRQRSSGVSSSRVPAQRSRPR